MSNTVGQALQAAANRSAEIVQIANAILTIKKVVPGHGDSVSLHKDRDAQEKWLYCDGRKNVFTTHDEGALAAGAYFVVTGNNFFLGDWGRVAGSGAALAFYHDGVTDTVYRDDSAEHFVRAVGSSES